jgi:hypothetical protein
MRRTVRSLVLALVLLSVPAAGEQYEVLFEPLAVTGLPAPGTPEGVVFGSLGSYRNSYAVISDSGVVAFWGFLDGVDQATERGAWISRLPGQVELLARAWDPAPGFPAGTTVWSVGQPALNSAGQVAFRGGVRRPDGEYSGGVLIADAAGNLSFLLETPVPLPDLPGAFLQSVSSSLALLNDAGQTAFLGTLSGEGIDYNRNRSIWGPQASGEIAMLAREDAIPPGMGSPFVVMTEVRTPVLDNLGRVAFRGTYNTLQGVRTAIFGPDGAVALGRVVISGQPAPGVADGLVFAEPGYDLSLNDRGQLAFSAHLAEEGNIWTLLGSGYWLREASGETLLLALVDAALPGLPPGRTVKSLSDLNLNDAGQIAFGAATEQPFEGPDEWGIWLRDVDGTFARLVNTGERAPGLPGQARFAAPREARLNRNGDVLFVTSLMGSGFDPEVDSALYLLPYGGKPILVARSGDLLEVAPDDLRALTAIDLDYLQDSGQRSFNVLGQVAFRARFEDGSEAIVVAEIPAMTEDDDGDGVVAVVDNCRSVSNPDQADADADGVGDACNDAEDADGDEYRDDLDACPQTPDDQQDRDGDGAGDACDPYPDDPDNEEAELRSELAVCDDALLTCLDRRFFIDVDGDGEEDSTDACPETPQGEAVDSAGCSHVQFCALVNELPRLGRLVRCARSDWQNDEPAKPLPQDCAISRDGGWWWWLIAECEAL